MSEIAIREEAAVALPAPQLPVPAMNDIDSWTQIVVQVVRLAQEICDTPFVPDGLRGSAPAVSAAILSGREMGLGPMTSLANIDVIRGKPTQKPLLMRAMIQSRGHTWEDVENTDFRAVVRARRKGESAWATVTFTADQARKAGLDLGKYPADKLYARATSRLAKHKFADVIMGMAYSSDEVEDGLDAEIAVTDGETAAVPAIEAPKADKSRTAQRRKAPPNASPAQPQQAAAPAPPAPQGAGEALPPLPGEEEEESSGPVPQGPHAGPDDTDYNTPGTIPPGMITAIWTVLNSKFSFTKDEKEQARMVCAHIANRELESTTNLSRNEAKTILDTLAHWQQQAHDKGEHPRDYLIAIMAAQEEADGGQ